MASQGRSSSSTMVATAPSPSTDSSRIRAFLAPRHAWRILHRRTGGTVSRATFYRWLDSGKLFSIHMGHRLYIPLPALEELIQESLVHRGSGR